MLRYVDQHLTWCAQVCFTGTEQDQAEQHDHGTIDEVLLDQDMEQGDAPEGADREGDLLEQMPLPGSSRIRERTPGIPASSSSPSSRRYQTTTSKLAT